MSEAIEEKPKRQRKPKEPTAIVVAEPEVRLGSLAINNPADLVTRASELATVLAEIIKKRKLFSTISGREFVKCEGWTTMGAMLGVIPVEDYCRPLSNGNGFEAKINLIRSRDGQMVGSASAECTRDENNWKKRDSYSLRSMALTRATGKAFRLSYSWIMQLAGFQPTPAEEMMGEEDAPILRQQVETEVERQKNGKAPTPPANANELLYIFPVSHNGHFAEFLNIRPYIAAHLDEEDSLRMAFTAHGGKKTKDETALVPAEKMPHLLEVLAGDMGIAVHELKAAQ